MASTVIDIKYSDKDLEKIKASNGIFSFCVYTGIGAFDKNISKFENISMFSGNKPPILYYIGLMSYLKMIQNNPDKWSGWNVIIHTDEATVTGNPKAFKKLEDNGAILGLTTLKGKYSDVSKFRGIFRNNRYYPLFIEGFNSSVFIRDADTIFENYLSDYLITKFSIKGRININKNEDIIFDDFIEKLSNWEYLFFTKISKFKNKVIFTYDNLYSLAVKNENNINSLVWTGNPENKPTNKSSFFTRKVRFLAGNVSKLGESLPIELWNSSFPTFLNTYITNTNIVEGGDKLLEKTSISDEVFLTEIIYKWCKDNKRAEFFKMNYVSDSRLSTLFNKYLQLQYKGNITKLNAKNKELYNVLYPKKRTLGKSGISSNFKRLQANKLALNHPEVPLNNEYFYNPLNAYDEATKVLKNKPEHFPAYFFGGKTTYKNIHRKNKKTRKHRK
jgi:hypothetical protein